MRATTKPSAIQNGCYKVNMSSFTSLQERAHTLCVEISLFRFFAPRHMGRIGGDMGDLVDFGV